MDIHLFEMHHVQYHVIRLNLDETQKSLSSEITEVFFPDRFESTFNIYYICMHLFTSVGQPGQKSQYGGRMRVSLITITTTAYQARSLPLGVSWTPGSRGVELCWVTSTANRRATPPHRWFSRQTMPAVHRIIIVAYFGYLSHLIDGVKKCDQWHLCLLLKQACRQPDSSKVLSSSPCSLLNILYSG